MDCLREATCDDPLLYATSCMSFLYVCMCVVWHLGTELGRWAEGVVRET